MSQVHRVFRGCGRDRHPYYGNVKSHWDHDHESVSVPWFSSYWSIEMSIPVLKCISEWWNTHVGLDKTALAKLKHHLSSITVNEVTMAIMHNSFVPSENKENIIIGLVIQQSIDNRAYQLSQVITHGLLRRQQETSTHHLSSDANSSRVGYQIHIRCSVAKRWVPLPYVPPSRQLSEGLSYHSSPPRPMQARDR